MASSPVYRARRMYRQRDRAATLEDVRAEVLTPDRLNANVFGGFAVHLPVRSRRQCLLEHR